MVIISRRLTFSLSILVLFNLQFELPNKSEQQLLSIEKKKKKRKCLNTTVCFLFLICVSRASLFWHLHGYDFCNENFEKQTISKQESLVKHKILSVWRYEFKSSRKRKEKKDTHDTHYVCIRWNVRSLIIIYQTMNTRYKTGFCWYQRHACQIS